MDTPPAPLLQDSVNMLLRRQYFGPELLPLPAYLSMAFGMLGTKVAHINLLLAICYTYVTLLTLRKYTHKHFIAFSFLFVIHSANYFGKIKNNDQFVIFFTSIFMRNILNDNEWVSCLSLSLLLSCDTWCIFLAFTFLYYRILKLFNFASNPLNKAASIGKEVLKTVLQTTLIPLALFFFMVVLDVKYRNNTSIKSLNCSLKYQLSLQPYPNVPLDEVHQMASEETDKYVMDGSYVEILNIKHNSHMKDFLNLKDTEKMLVKLTKIHPKEFSAEENRYIKNGDIVEMVNAKNEKFITAVHTNEKFSPLAYYSDSNNDKSQNFWRVDCNGYLLARSTEVKFVHTKTGYHMGCRKFKSHCEFHGSNHSEHKSRLFFISKNINLDFYKTNFKDQRCKETTSEFKKFTVKEMIGEYLSKIAKKRTDSLIEGPPSDEALISLKNIVLKNALFSFTIILAVVFASFLMFNHVLSLRYNKSFILSELSYFMCAMFGLVALSSHFLGLNKQMLYYISSCFVFSVLSSVLSVSSKVTHMDKKK